MSKVESALAWAERGFRVFPLSPGTKIPLKDSGWTEEATSDPETIRTVFGQADYNVGVLTNGHVVLDVDVKGGKPGEASLLALNLPHRETLAVRTPSGGYHIYFSGPSRANVVGSSENSPLGHGVDVRSYNGYVLAPGSWLDPAYPRNEGVGGFYEVVNEAPILPAPESLIARLDAPRERSSAPAPAADLDRPDTILRARDYLKGEAPLAVEGDGGDALTFRVAARLKDYGLTHELALALMLDLWNDRCSPPWSDEELRQKVENAYAYGLNAPGSDSFQADFAGVVIDAPPQTENTRRFDRFRHGDPRPVNKRWLVKKTLPESGVAMLVAPTTAGKTFLALDLARAVAEGVDWFGEKTQKGSAILLATEGWAEVSPRFEALNVDGRLPITAFDAEGLGQPGALQQLAVDIVEEAASLELLHGAPLRLIILDTLSQSGLLADENDNAKASAMVSALKKLSKATGALVLVVHHPAKAGKGVRGAGALTADLDAVIEISQEGPRAAVRVVELTKCRGAPKRTMGAFSLETVTLGVDEDGEDITSCRVSASDSYTASAPPPVGSSEFVQLLGWEIDAHGEDTEGGPAVTVGHMQSEFKDRGVGSWQKVIAWAIETQAVKEVQHFGKRYLAVNRFEVPEEAA